MTRAIRLPIELQSFHAKPPQSSIVEHFSVADAPDVALRDPALALADLDVAPAAVAFFDAADDAMLGAVADRRVRVGLDADVARLARLDDARCGGRSAASPASSPARRPGPRSCASWDRSGPPGSAGRGACRARCRDSSCPARCASSLRRWRSTPNRAASCPARSPASPSTAATHAATPACSIKPPSGSGRPAASPSARSRSNRTGRS